MIFVILAGFKIGESEALLLDGLSVELSVPLRSLVLASTYSKKRLLTTKMSTVKALGNCKLAFIRG